MSLTRRTLLASVALSAMFAGTGPLAADEPLDVVASFSILGDLVRQVGGERVQVDVLVGPGADAHVVDSNPNFTHK